MRYIRKLTPQRAVVYCRGLTDVRPVSRSDQKSSLEELADVSNLKILRWYRERADSGEAIDGRPVFSRMLEAARRGRFGVILCENTDVLARVYSLDLALAVAAFQRAGVRLAIPADGFTEWETFLNRLSFPGHPLGSRRETSTRTVSLPENPVFVIVHALAHEEF